MIATIKRYWLIGLSALIAILLFAVKILTGQNSRLRAKVETAEAKIHHAKVVEEKKVETAKELRSRKADLVKELEEKKTSSELESPNEW